MTDRVWDFENGTPNGRPTPSVPPIAPTNPATAGSPPVLAPVSAPFGYGQPGSQIQPAQPQAAQTQQLTALAGPPIIGVNDQQSSAKPSKKRTGLRMLAAFVAGGVVAGGSFSAGQYFSDDGSAASSAEATTVSTEAAGSSESAPDIILTPPDPDVTEPAEYVAAVLGPSIVQVETELGVGSGIVFADNRVITNHHVIADAVAIRVRTSDGRTIEATLVGSDPQVDVAVLDLGEDSGLPVATLALEDEPQVGQSVFAIGSPFQLQQSITAGIVSALNRPVSNGEGINAMIQSDTSINPGNSGGALADRSGRVIGINTSIRTDGVVQGSVGISFSIPIDTAMRVATRIINGESLEPGFLGVGNAQVSETGEGGVLIGEVIAGSGAEAAGVQVGDRLIRINGSPVTSLSELAGLVRASFPGDSVTLEFVRGEETLVVEATLGER